LEAYFWKYFLNPVRLIDHFIFVSNFSKGKHQEFNNAFHDKFTQIYNFTHFTNHKNFQILRGEYFLYFGRLSVEKGVGTLISAFSGKKNHKLKIAGTGPLKELVAQSSIENQNISYVGFKTGKDLEELIKNASFVILPSECYENNPLSIIEAYSFGKPVIGANIAGIPELIKDGINGFLFKSGDRESLEKAIEDSGSVTDSEYESFSGSVYNFAQSNFDIRNHYLSLMKVYNYVIDKNNPE
jgi:glycosyltransferase involved in cell wall biosynthesis